MKQFDLFEPTSVSEATGFLNQFGAKAKIVAGGSDLLGGIMKDWVTGKGMPLPDQIIDLTTIPDLKGIKPGTDGFHIGTTTTLSELIEHADLTENVLKPNEVMTEVFVPTPAAGTKMAWSKLKDRQVYDFAVVSVAAVFTVDGVNWKDGRITLGGVAPVPYRAQVVENALKGKDIKASVKAAAAQLRTVARPMSLNAYKIDLAQGLIERTILDALG